MVYLNEIILAKWGKRTERTNWQLSGSGLGLQLLQIHIFSSTTALNLVGIYSKHMSRRLQQFSVIDRLMLLICLDPEVKNCCLHLISYVKHVAAITCGG